MFKNEPPKNRGTLLAQGTGVNRMMDVSYKRKLNNENSVLYVENPDDFNSKWKIYSRVKNK